MWRCKNRLIAFLICIATIIAQPGATRSFPRVQRQENVVTQAVSDLQSPDFRLRDAAKKQLLSAGSASVEPIISLLSELLDAGISPTSNMPRDVKRDSPLGVDEHKVRATGNWALVVDCCWLLGQLRAAQAVPLLIRVIEVDEIFSMLPKRVTEINSLGLIGKPAEAALLSEFRNAYGKAAMLVGLDLPDEHTRKLRVQERKALDIQMQVGAALALIGDNETIAALENLLVAGEIKGSGRSIIDSTISQIKARYHYGPTR